MPIPNALCRLNFDLFCRHIFVTLCYIKINFNITGKRPSVWYGPGSAPKSREILIIIRFRTADPNLYRNGSASLHSHSHRGRTQLKKYLTSVAAIAIAAGCATAVRAQDATINGITFYGIVDAGVAYETHGTPPQDGGSVGTYYVVNSPGGRATFTAAQSGLSQSRWGIRGAEDLGDGWTGIFRVEQGFNVLGGQIADGIRSIVNNNGLALQNRSAYADSSQDGQMFNRQAYVGIQNNKYGTLMIGRQQTLQNDIIGAYDPNAGSYAYSLIGFSGSFGGNGSTEDVRWDNSVKYLGAYGPVRLGLMYQFGGTITRNDTGEGVDVGFDYMGLSVDGTYTHKKDVVTASPLSAAQMLTTAALGYNPQNSFSATVSDDDAYGLAAKYTWEKFKFFGGFEHIKWSNPSSPLPVGFINIGNYIGSVVSNTAYNNPKEQTIYFGGVKYAAMTKLDVTAAFYGIDQNSYATGANTGCNDTRAGSCSGQEYVYSLNAVYHFTKKFDAYGGAMYSQVVNGLANGFLHNNQMTPSVGFRYTW